jgi:uncharacterized protein YhaN
VKIRFLELDLENWGFRSATRLQLDSQCKVHVIHGTNEAGKSTMLRALELLLFGLARGDSAKFPSRAKVAALLALDESPVRCERALGRRDDLIWDAAFPYVEPVGRDEFQTMFGLSLNALREGSEALLADPQASFAQTLVAAAFSGSNPERMHQAMDDAAGSLYKKRGTKQKIPLLLAKMQQYEEAALRASASPQAFALQEQALREIEAELATRTENLEASRRKLDALERRERAKPHLRRARSLDQELQELLTLPAVALDARRAWQALRKSEPTIRERLDASVNEHTQALAQLATIQAPRESSQERVEARTVLRVRARELDRITTELETLEEQSAAAESRMRDLEDELPSLRQLRRGEPEADAPSFYRMIQRETRAYVERKTLLRQVENRAAELAKKRRILSEALSDLPTVDDAELALVQAKFDWLSQEAREQRRPALRARALARKQAWEQEAKFVCGRSCDVQSGSTGTEISPTEATDWVVAVATIPRDSWEEALRAWRNSLDAETRANGEVERLDAERRTLGEVDNGAPPNARGTSRTQTRTERTHCRSECGSRTSTGRDRAP